MLLEMLRREYPQRSDTGPCMHRFVVADDTGVDGSAAPSTPARSSVGTVDVQTRYNNRPNCQQRLKTQDGVAFSAVR